MITSKNRAILQSEMSFFCTSTRHFTTICISPLSCLRLSLLHARDDIYDGNLLFDSEARRNEFHYFVEL